MVCDSCRGVIFEGSDGWGFLVLSHFKRSDGCIICARLKSDWERFPVITSKPQAPVYWWTIRRPGRIRECQEYYSVTFRADAHAFSLSSTPPARTFVLVKESTLRSVPKLESRTNSPASIAQIKLWIEDCGERHERCRVPQVPSWFPKRLIDVGRDSGDRVILVTTDDDNFEKDKYLTLSHCWGNQELSPLRITLSSENMGIFTNPQQGINWMFLPNNFRDAVVIARALHVRYIWIDALCIVQNNGEFHREGHLMHLVYRNSFCNLASVASKDSHGGFFHDRQNPEIIIPQTIKTSSSSAVFGERTWWVLPSDIWADKLLDNILYTRGWVFQERMLSPRILHFSRDQVFWDCATMSACETLPALLPGPLDDMAATERHWRERLQAVQRVNKSAGEGGYTASLSGSADDSIEVFWKRAVRNYTECGLSHWKDRLTAIWGVAKHVRDQLRHDLGGQEYGAGLWSTNLCEQLGWRVTNPSKSEQPEELADLPSWSWASVTGRIDLQDRFSDPYRFYQATNHQGQGLQFELADGAPELWKDLPGGADDLHPGLKTPELAIKGNLIAVKVEVSTAHSRRNDAGGRSSADSNLTLKLVDTKHGHVKSSDDNFEVSPDVRGFKPDGPDRNLLILAASQNNDSPSLSEVNDSALVYGIALVVEQDKGPRGSERHFRRVAVCHFRGLKRADYDNLNPDGGTNIWLV